MNRLACVMMTVLLGGCLVMAMGCADPKDQELKNLRQQCNEMSLTNTDLKKSLADGQSKSTDLMAQLETKDLELASAKKEITDLKAKKAGPVGTGTTGTAVAGRTRPPVPKDWTETETGAKIEVGSDILFPPGKGDLTAPGLAKIKDIAATIKKTYPDAHVRVYGYTDSDPIHKTAKLWDDNLDLSAYRAMAVTRQLIKLGIAADTVETIAMGATHPIASNASAKEKAKNRRVEIVVIAH